MGVPGRGAAFLVQGWSRGEELLKKADGFSPSFLLLPLLSSLFFPPVEQTAQQHIFHHQSFAEGNSPPLLHFFLMFTDRKANGLWRTAGTAASWGQSTEPTPLAQGSRSSLCSWVLSVNHSTVAWDGQRVAQLQPEPCMVGMGCGDAREGMVRDVHCMCHVPMGPQCHRLTPHCECMTPRHSREGQPDLCVVCVVFVTSYISPCPEEAPHLRTCHPVLCARDAEGRLPQAGCGWHRRDNGTVSPCGAGIRA